MVRRVPFKAACHRTRSYIESAEQIIPAELERLYAVPDGSDRVEGQALEDACHFLVRCGAALPTRHTGHDGS